MNMPFGKHNGQDIGSIPRGYLRWLRDNVHLDIDLAEAVDCAIAKLPIPARRPTIEERLEEILYGSSDMGSTKEGN